MRRLPVFFVIDVSESMIGEPIQQVEKGINEIMTELKRDPQALETVHVSVICFAGRAKTIVPLTEIVNFYPPQIPIGGGTSYGEAFRHLIGELDSKVVKNTTSRKGDYKPIIFFMTDGNPTDDYRIDLGRWAQTWRDRSNIVAVTIGGHVNNRILKAVSNQVLEISTANADSYREFFRWVTDSIKVKSQAVDSGGSGNEGLSTSGVDLKKVKTVNVDMPDPTSEVDDHVAIFQGKCQSTKRGYLVKYEVDAMDQEFAAAGFAKAGLYTLAGAYPLPPSYGELSDGTERGGMHQMSTEKLRGMPSCPCCSHQFAMAICQCGGIFCLDGGGIQTCPNCNVTSQFGAGDGHIDINRRQG